MSFHRAGELIPLAVLVAMIGVMAIGGGVAADETDEGHFEVEITGANESIAEGDTLVVDATVTNTGNTTDSQQIHLKAYDSEIVDSIAGPPVTLAPGESENVTLRWETERGDAGNMEFAVASNDEYPERSVEIREGEFVDVTLDEHNSSITAGEELTVSVDLTNTGNGTATPRTWFALHESIMDERSVELEPGETERVTLTWESNASHVGEWTLTAGADDERTEGSTIVIEPDSDDASDPDETADPNETADPDDASYSTGGGSDLVMERSNSLIEGTVANVSWHDVDRVEFAETVDGKIAAVELRRPPADADEVDDVVAVYRIEVPEAASETAATVQLTVDEEVLDGADAEEVLVTHWDGEGWTELPTEAATNDGAVTISAETQGFSLFAVTTGDVPADDATDETETATTTETATATTETPSSTDTSTSTEGPSSTPESEATRNDEETPGFGVGAALLALTATVTIGAYRRRLT